MEPRRRIRLGEFKLLIEPSIQHNNIQQKTTFNVLPPSWKFVNSQLDQSQTIAIQSIEKTRRHTGKTTSGLLPPRWNRLGQPQTVITRPWSQTSHNQARWSWPSRFRRFAKLVAHSLRCCFEAVLIVWSVIFFIKLSVGRYRVQVFSAVAVVDRKWSSWLVPGVPDGWGQEGHTKTIVICRETLSARLGIVAKNDFRFAAIML